MKNQFRSVRKTFLLAFGLGGALLLCCTAALAQANSNTRVFPPGSTPNDKSYAQWVGEFWKWALPLPVEGHPFLDTNPVYDLSAHQSGDVWFWSAPDGPLTRMSR